MSELEQLREIREIVQVAYDLAQKNLREILAAETIVRNELSRLNEIMVTARMEAQNSSEMQVIGADMVWQSWVGRTKTELNMKLARILAEKEPHMFTIRRAYGKVLAVQELIEKAEKALKKRAENAAFDEVLSHL